MDMTTQIELETLFAKNQVMTRIKSEFRTDEVIEHTNAWEVPLDFALDLLAQMHLHKRTTMSILVGLLHKHFGTEVSQLQATADMIWHCADADLVDFDPTTWMFVIRPGATISAEAQDDLDRYQYPLPMVVKPKHVSNNKQTGYATITGSIILKHNHHDDDVCLDHINRVNQIPLVINADTARMIQNQWKGLDKKASDEDQEDFEKRVKAFEKYDRVSRDVMETLFMTGEAFYLTHKYDKRGRCYAQGYHVSTQNNAWGKAVIEFANQEMVQ